MTIYFKVANPKLISTNEMYYHPVRKTKSGRYMSYVCKSENLKSLQEYYKDILPDLIPDATIEDLKRGFDSGEYKGLSLKLCILVPMKELYEHDGTNFIKAIEDCISSRLKIDDSRNLQVSVEKVLSDSDDWSLEVLINTMSQVRTYPDALENKFSF